MGDWLLCDELRGTVVTLEPLSTEHIDELALAAADGDGWKLWYTSIPRADDVGAYVITALEKKSIGEVPFAVRLKSDKRVVGTTRFYDVAPAHRRASIGYTWYAQSVRRTAVNTECKLLMLSCMFDQCNAIAVEFRTHFFNHASRRAIERLGAKLDGILRSHQILEDGSIRDSAVYSIIASEWPAVKRHLQAKLES